MEGLQVSKPVLVTVNHNSGSSAGSFLGLWAAPLRFQEAGFCRRSLTLTNALLVHPRITDRCRADALLLELGDILVGVVGDIGTILVYPRQDEVVLTGPGMRMGKYQSLQARDHDEGEVHNFF